MRLISCLQCQGRLSDQAETCPDCGYPAPGGSAEIKNARAIAGDSLRQYRALRLIGLAAMGIGVVAAMGGLHTGATIVGIGGAATYLIGLLGAWWNT